jgi:hypothetical protein
MLAKRVSTIVPGSRAGPCQLAKAKPSGDLLLHRPAEGSDAQRFSNLDTVAERPLRLSVLTRNRRPNLLNGSLIGKT